MSLRFMHDVTAAFTFVGCTVEGDTLTGRYGQTRGLPVCADWGASLHSAVLYGTSSWSGPLAVLVDQGPVATARTMNWLGM
jgi:hypothetical protein